MESHFAPPAPHVQAYVEQLLNAGGTLLKLLDNLADAVVAKGTMGEEEAADELLDMLMGTVAVRLSSIPEADFVRATELMELAVNGVLADLERAAELARQRERRHGARSVRSRRDRAARRP
jgi:hypothetical protein